MTDTSIPCSLRKGRQCSQVRLVLRTGRRVSARWDVRSMAFFRLAKFAEMVVPKMLLRRQVPRPSARRRARRAMPYPEDWVAASSSAGSYSSCQKRSFPSDIQQSGRGPPHSKTLARRRVRLNLIPPKQNCRQGAGGSCNWFCDSLRRATARARRARAVPAAWA